MQSPFNRKIGDTPGVKSQRTLKETTSRQKQKLIKKATNDVLDAYGSNTKSQMQVSESKKRLQTSRDRAMDSENSSGRMSNVRKLYDWDYETVDWINRNAMYVNSSAVDIDREATINASNLK